MRSCTREGLGDMGREYSVAVCLSTVFVSSIFVVRPYVADVKSLMYAYVLSWLLRGGVGLRGFLLPGRCACVCRQALGRGYSYRAKREMD